MLRRFLSVNLSFLLFPTLVFAKTLDAVLTGIIDQIKDVPKLLLGVAVLYFMYAVLKYVGVEGKEREKAAVAITWGLVALFVITATVGLVKLIQETLSL